MKEARILIVRVGTAPQLFDRVSAILASFEHPDIRSLEWTIQDVSSLSVELENVVSAFGPDVGILIAGPSSLTHTRYIVRHFRERATETPLILVSDDGSPGRISELLKLGLTDYVTVPIKALDLLPRLWRLVEDKIEKERAVDGLKEELGLGQIIGKSPAFLSEVQKIPVIAQSNACVLITGETGTGKELCAQAIHYLSPRAAHPFISVNCGSIPSELVENELFGHVKGAYTGAHATEAGLVQETENGTLFLDDIDTLPLQAQTKFLRFVQQKDYKQLGSTKTCRANVRVVAATNIDIEDAVQKGGFRRDLFYRLNVLPVNLPSLRERKEDIPLLARHFLLKYGNDLGKVIKMFSREAMSALLNHDWPGNVRELENVVERAVVFTTGPVVERKHIVLSTSRDASLLRPVEPFNRAKARVVEEFEKDYVERLLRVNSGNLSRAAREAHKHRRAFWELVRKHRIDVNSLRNSVPQQ